MAYGGTTVLCTATASKKDTDGFLYSKLSRKAFAAGKIPGGFLKRR